MSARRFLPAFLALLACTAVGEVAARRWLEAPYSTTLDARFGFVQRPGSRVVQSREGWGAYTANSDGFLDDEWRGPSRGPRALLMGDSFTEGLQVRAGERYSEVVERLVPGLDVLNVAVAGRSPIHYALYMPRFQAEFHPALVIVQVDDGDLSEMEDARANAESLDEFHARGTALAQDRPRGAGVVGVLRGAFRRSALLSELSSRVQQLARQERSRLGQKLGGRRASLEDVVARPATPRAEAMVDSLIGEVVRVNPRILVVYLPHIRYFDAVPLAAYPARRRWYHALAERRHLPLVDPTDAMLAEFRRTHEPLQGFLNARPGEGHLNARGHRVLGGLLAGALLRLTGSGGAWADSVAGFGVVPRRVPTVAADRMPGAGARP